jgi:D-serine deaminase-like pyridoxal phosphate-dependent protein
MLPEGKYSTIIDQAHERCRGMYASDIGQPRSHPVTPALLLDLDVLEANLAYMGERMRSMPTDLRAHVKVHKSPHIARMQVDAGAIGVGTATVWEAIVMASAGINDVFVINELVGPEKTRAAALLGRRADVKVAVDDASNVRELSRAAQSAGSTIGVLIEIDTGMHRCGVTDRHEALELARRISESPGLRFRGLTGYEGHCTLEKDREKRHRMAREAMDFFTGIADFLAADGLSCEILTAAGTGTWEVTASNPRLTEIQPGSYATMDPYHYALDPRFKQAVSVLSSCISRRKDHLVLDAGNKTVGATSAVLRDHELSVYRFDEEHSIFNIDGSCPIRVGDKVELLCSYTPFAVGYFDSYHVLRGGTITDVWPVLPRGPESRWLLDLLERNGR